MYYFRNETYVLSGVCLKVKSGPSAGTFVALASIIVMDQYGTEMKIVLWRQAAFWALTLSPGDVLLLSGKQIHLTYYLHKCMNIC